VELYTAIADSYDDIFPLDPAQAAFIASRLPPGCRILDSGCASGSLAFDLASRGFQVVGIDLSARLIAQAVRKARSFQEGSPAPEFRLLDMLAAPAAFPQGSFQALVCLGNTLPHLPGPARIGECLKGFRRLLGPGGLLVLQLIDFEKVAARGLSGLPAIENGKLRFERDYPGLEPGKPFDFSTRLWLKPSAEPIRGATRLYALARSELDALLAEAGFSERAYLSGFEAPPPESSLALVVVAS
jgi:glycine/sarcosine N-methyltransferase